MKPLRPLAKDWNYRVTDDGWLFVRTGGPEIFTAIPYRSAPAECFADAEGPVREGNRVVVVMATEDGPTSPVCRFAGKHGVAAKGEAGVVWVRFDGDSSVWDISRRNLRREREDERPAEPKPEPPPRKFADGQCVQQPYGCSVAIITGAVFWDGEWRYKVDKGQKHTGTEWNWSEHLLSPCPPPLSEAQRRLQPGDKVRVREEGWDAEGRSWMRLVQVSGLDTWMILSSCLHDGCIRAEIERKDAAGQTHRRRDWLHNLEPTEEK